MVIPGKFHPKKLYEYVKFGKKNSRSPKGVAGLVSKSEDDQFGMSDGIFFFVEKKLIIVIFGVRITGVYRNIAITSTLFRDHSQN